uniref:Ribonucleoprotein, chloroplastic n=1 Tax=Anthurium amnicola TaxID=1678845 RepID=A0A1D1XID7_9ARAE
MALSATSPATPAALLSSSSSSSSPAAIRVRVSVYPRPSSSSFVSLPSSRGRRGGGPRKRLSLQLFSAVEGYALVEKGEQELGEEGATEKGGEATSAEEGGGEKRRKLHVANLPWDFTAPDMRELFGQCGTVTDVEIIKQKNGKSRGFAFITMSSAEAARAVIEKFDSYELQERIIRVEFAKSMKKTSSRPAGSAMETRHKIYVSNLAWKARSSNLRELFSAKFKPVSARVVFNTPSGKAAGYGFVSFSTKEEMEAAISELDGEELMGRPVRLKISERKDDNSGSETEATEINGSQ